MAAWEAMIVAIVASTTMGTQQRVGHEQEERVR